MTKGKSHRPKALFQVSKVSIGLFTTLDMQVAILVEGDNLVSIKGFIYL